MKKEFTVQIAVTASAETNPGDVARLINQSLDFYSEGFSNEGLDVGCAQVIKEYNVADPDADEFECAQCSIIADIDDSMKTAEGLLICATCYAKKQGLRRCEVCNADLTLYDSVQREYVDKSGGESVHGLGMYMPDGTFEPTSKVDLSEGQFDLLDDSDRCAACGHPL